MTVPTILDVLDDPALLGDAFAEPSWGHWRAFLGALFGLPLRTTSRSSRASTRGGRTSWRPAHSVRPGSSSAAAQARAGSSPRSRSTSPRSSTGALGSLPARSVWS